VVVPATCRHVYSRLQAQSHQVTASATSQHRIISLDGTDERARDVAGARCKVHSVVERGGRRIALHFLYILL